MTDKMALSVTLDVTAFNKGIEEMNTKIVKVKETLDSFDSDKGGFAKISESLNSIVPQITGLTNEIKNTNTEVAKMGAAFNMSITQLQSFTTKVEGLKGVTKGAGDEMEQNLKLDAAMMLPETTIAELKKKLATIAKAKENIAYPNLIFGQKEKEQAISEMDRLKNKIKELGTSERELARQREVEAQKQSNQIAKEIADRKKLIQVAQQGMNRTYDGAIRTADSATTIEQRTAAIKNLVAARERLSTADVNYTDKLRALNSQISRLDRENKQAIGSTDKLNERKRNLMDTASQLQRRLALVFSVSAITGYFQKLVEIRGEMELQVRSLQSILQSKNKADELFAQVTELAVRSPFQIGELISYTKQLAAYRVETEKLFDTTKMLADVSAGLGVDMQRLILAYGQVKAANFLRGTELRQFSEAGINILGELASQFSLVEGRAVSTGEVFERVSKRMVSFGDVEEVFKKLTTAGGIFYNMQEIQAETLKGQVSNLRDAISLMFNEIGEANEGVLKGFVSLIRSIVENWEAFRDVLIAVAYGYGVVKVRQLLVTQGLFSQYNALKLVAIEENKRMTRALQAELVASKTTKARVAQIQLEIAALKNLSAAQYTNILSTTQMSKSKAQLLVAMNPTNQALRTAMITTKTLTYEETLAAAKTNIFARSVNILKFSLSSIGVAAKAATAALGTMLITMLPMIAVVGALFAVTKIWSSISESNKALADNTKTYNDLRDTANGIEAAFHKATIAAKNFNSTTSKKNPIVEQRKELQKLIDQLNDLGFEAEINVEELNSTQLITTFKELSEELRLTTNFAETASQSFLKFNSVWTGGDFWGNKIKTDLEQVNTAFSDMAANDSKLDKFSLTFEKLRNSLSEVGKATLDQFNLERQDNETNEAYLLRRIKLAEKLYHIATANRSEERKSVTIEEWNNLREFYEKRINYIGKETEAIREADRWIKEYLKMNLVKDISVLTDKEKLRLKVGFDQALVKNEVAGVAAELARAKFIATIEFKPAPAREQAIPFVDWRTRVTKFQEEAKLTLIDNSFLEDTSKQFVDFVSLMNSLIDSTNKELETLRDSKDNVAITEVKRLTDIIDGAKNALKLFGLTAKETGKGKDIILERTKAQIQAIKDAQKAYEEYLKYFSRDESVAKVKKDFTEVFKNLKIDMGTILDFNQASNIELLEKLTKGLKGASLKELQKVIANLKAEVEVELQVQNIDRFKQEIQNSIDNYELTVEITKLGFSPELIRALFNQAAVTIEDLKKFYNDNATDLGINKTYTELIKMTGEEQLKLVKDGNQERLKEVIKLAEKINDVERKALEKRLNDYSAIVKEYQSFEDKITAIRKKAIQDRANAETDLASQPEAKKIVLGAIDTKEAQDVSKVLFDVIKDTDLWALTFENLEKIGDEAITMLLKSLKQYRDGAGKNLDITQYKELIKSMEKLEDQAKKRNPFRTLYNSIIEYNNAISDSEQKLTIVESAQLRYNAAVANYGENSPQAVQAQKVLTAATNEYATAANDAQKSAYYLNSSTQQIIGYMNGANDAIRTTTQSAYELAASLGLIGDESEKTGEYITNLVDSQLTALEGVASIIGGAYSGKPDLIISGISKAASGTWASIQAAVALWGKDGDVQENMDKLNDELELLKKNFDNLNDVTFDSTNITDFNRNFKDLTKNIQEQYETIEKLRTAEESKKKSDSEAIQQYTDDLDELAKREKELREQRYDNAGIFELKQGIQEIADAWYAAYYAQEDTLNATTNKVKEFVRNYIKQMMLMQGADVILNKVRQQMIAFLENDGLLDSDEMGLLNNAVTVASEELNNFFASISDGISAFSDVSGNMSELQKGISQITESTAEALEALLNSIRLRMFEHYSINEMRGLEITQKLEQSNAIAAQILADTSAIRTMINQMRSWQESITTTGHVSGGYALKVKAEMVS